MKLIKFHAKKLLFILLAFIASFALIACGGDDDDAEKIIKEALGSITLGDVSTLNSDFDITNYTNLHNLEIKWELIDADETLDLVKKNDQWTTVKVTPTPYTEDENGNQTNGWGQGILKATVTYNNKSDSRQWTLYVSPGTKTTVMTIDAAKKVANGTGVEVEGFVTLVLSNQFIIHDNTGGVAIFLDSAPDENIKVGAKVSVKGEKGLYYGQPQVGVKGKKPTVKVLTAAPSTGYDYSKAETMSIKDINSKTTENVDFFFKIIKITGKVLKDYISPANNEKAGDYAIKDELTNEIAVLHIGIDQSVKTALQSRVGQYVTVTIIVFEYHSQLKLWRHYAVPGTVVDAEAPTLSDEEIIASVKAEVEGLYKGKNVYDSLNLITTGTAGGTITWSSDKPEIIANDGTFNRPQENTEVTLTFTIKSGTKQETYTLKVMALALTEMPIKDVIDALDEKDSLVMFRGTIIGKDADDYYYVADDTGVIYVRHKLSDNNLKVGDKVKVTGLGTVYNVRSSSPNQYIRQINGSYSVEKVDTAPTPIAIVDAQIRDFDNTIKAAEMTSKVPLEELYGRVVRFTDVYLIVKGNNNDLYIATENSTSVPSLLIYHRSMGDSDLRELIGKKVTIIAVVNGFHGTNGWRLSFMANEGDLVFNITDQEKLELAEEEIESIVSDNKTVTGDLDFITTSGLFTLKGVKYVWTSSNTQVLSNTGKVTAPSQDTEVDVTVKVYLDGNTEGEASATWTYKVVVKAKKQAATGVIISQVYGGGGNSGAPIKSDFIELYNTTDEDIDITGWTIFYASATGNFKAIGSESYDVGIVLSGVIKAKSFFLIKASEGNNKDLPDVPTPDATTGIAMGATEFKVALCNSDVVPTGPDSENIVDFVGAGKANLYEGSAAAPAPSNAKAIVRANLTDTNNNGADFIVADPNPRNSSYKEK